MAKKKDTINPRRSIQSEIVAKHGEKAVEEAKRGLATTVFKNGRVSCCRCAWMEETARISEKRR